MAYLPEVRGAVDTANSTTTPLGALATFTGQWTDVTLYDGVTVLVDGTAVPTAAGTLAMQFSHDGSTVHRSISIAVDDVAATPPRTLGCIARFFRIVYTNGGVAHSTFDLQVMLKVGFVRLVSRLDQAIGTDEDVQNIRAMLSGLDVLAGSFSNVSVASSTNQAGSYSALQVATGARPSQLPGRTPIVIVVDNITAPSLEHTVALSKTLYVTDLLLTIVNQGAVTGLLEIYDALSATGSPLLPISSADPGSGGDDTITVFNHSFQEPLAFSTGVFFDEVAGTLVMSGVMLGYEE